MSCAPAARDARSTALESGATLIRAMFSATVPSNSSTVCEMNPTCRPRASASHWSSAAPSSRTLPFAGRQIPTSVRTSEVLPAPLGPMMPTASPALRAKRAPVTIGVVPPGAATVTCSTSRLRAGFGSAVAARRGAARVSASDSRVIPWRAATKARQLAIAVSIGASARPIMIEAATIAPALSSWRSTR
jgi:hypothetical protein